MRRVRRGGPIGWGGSDVALYLRGASSVDRILERAKPGDLPIGQASVFDLAINTRTAKALGVAIPETILSRADWRIE
jgi:putative ABC transport system substrate-binding protein